MKSKKIILRDLLFKVFIGLAIIMLIFLSSQVMKQEKPMSIQLIEIIDKDEEEQLSKEELEKYQIEIEKELEKALNTDKDNFIIKRCYYTLGAIKYLTNQYDESIEYFQEALHYIGAINSKQPTYELDIKIYSALSSSYIHKKEVEQSIPFFEQAKIIALNNNQEHLLCEVYYGRAKAIGKYDITEAIDLMRKSLEYTDIDQHRIRNYLYLSTLYKVKSKFNLATEYTLNALEIAMKLNNNELFNKCIINLGENYYIQNNYSKTIEIYDGLIKIGKLRDTNNILTAYGYLAECYAKTGDYLNYRKYRQEYLDIAYEINAIGDLAWMYLTSAEAEIEYKNIDLAKEYLEKAQELYSSRESYMYANIDLALKYIENRIAYLEGKEYDEIVKNYNSLLKELNSRGIAIDLTETIINEALEMLYNEKDYGLFLKYLIYTKDYKSSESSQAYTDSIFTGINNTLKEKRFLKIKIGLMILCITTIMAIYELIESNKKNKKISRLNQELKELNTIDPLTKVYNKGHLNERLKSIYEHQEEVSFIMIDIDYFKLYNDNYGHLKGDKALVEVAKVIKTVFEKDMVFRYGGEEFFVVSYKRVEELIEDLDQLQREIYNRNIIHAHSQVSDRITLSMGVARDKLSTEQQVIELTKKADKNLYKSKEQGRNRYTY